MTRTRATYLVYAVLGFYGWFIYGFGPVVPLLRDEQGTTRAVASLHGTALAIGALAAGALYPLLARKIGRDRTLWTTLGGLSIGVIIIAVVPSTPVLTIAATLGAGTAGAILVNSIAPTLLSIHGPAFSGAALTEGNAIACAVGLVAPLAVGFSLDRGYGWRPALVVVCVLAAAIAVLARATRTHLPTSSVSHSDVNQAPAARKPPDSASIQLPGRPDATQPPHPLEGEWSLDAGRSSLPPGGEQSLNAARSPGPQEGEQSLNAARSPGPQEGEQPLDAGRSSLSQEGEQSLNAARSPRPHGGEQSPNAAQSPRPHEGEWLPNTAQPLQPHEGGRSLDAARSPQPQGGEQSPNAGRSSLPQEGGWSSDAGRLARPSEGEWLPNAGRSSLPQEGEQPPNAAQSPRPSEGEWLPNTAQPLQPHEGGWSLDAARSAQPHEGERLASSARRAMPRKFWVTWLVMLCCIAAEFATTLWASDVLRHRTGSSAAVVTAAVTAVIGGMCAGRIVGAVSAARVPGPRLLLPALGVALAGGLLFWITTSPVVAIVGLAILGLGLGPAYPLSMDLAMQASDDQPDRAAGYASYAAGLAVGGGPFALGALADQVGPHGAFLVVPTLFCMAIAGVALILTPRNRPR